MNSQLLFLLFLSFATVLATMLADLLTVGPGSACVLVGVRCGGGSVCVSGICVCGAVELAFGGVCAASGIRHVSPGEQCGGSADHCLRGSYCNATVRLCLCVETTQIPVGGRCLERLRSTVGMPCDNGELCVNGAVCGLNGLCECPRSSAVRYGKHCEPLKKAGVGLSCSSQEACVVGAECDVHAKKCVCKPGLLVHNQLCQPTIFVLPGGKCDFTAREATSCAGGSHCSYGICTCPPQSIVSAGYCIRLTKQLYNNYDNYNPLNAAPRMIAAPASGDISGAVRSTSLPLPPGSPCDATTVCLGGSNCIARTCTCPAALPQFDARTQQCITARAQQEQQQHQLQNNNNRQNNNYDNRDLANFVNVWPFAEGGRGLRWKRSINALPNNYSLEILSDKTAENENRIRKKRNAYDDANYRIASQEPNKLAEESIGTGKNTGEENEEEGVINHLRIEMPKNEVRNYLQNTGTASAVDREFNNVLNNYDKDKNNNIGDDFVGVKFLEDGSGAEKRFLMNFQDGSSIFAPVMLGFGCENNVEHGEKMKHNANNADGELEEEKEVEEEEEEEIGFWKKKSRVVLICAVENAVCRNDLCQCAPTFVQAGRALCLAREKIANTVVGAGMNCGPGDFCDGGSACVRGVCVCPSGFSVVGANCIHKHDALADDTHAAVELSSNSLGASKIDDVAFQHSIVKKSPGLNCRQNPNVCTGGSYCYNGYCVCPEGYDERNGECVIPRIYVDPGQSCDRPINSIAQVECTGNSVCANGFCVCPNGEPIQNNVCVTLNSVAAPGEACVQNVTRCTGNAECVQGVCQCVHPQVSLNGQCATINVITQLPNQPCNSAAQTICLGNSYCHTGRCQCLPNTVLTRGGTYCQPITVIMQPVGGGAYQCFAATLPETASTQQQPQQQQSQQQPQQQSQQQQNPAQQTPPQSSGSSGTPTQQWVASCPRGTTPFCGAGICVCVNGQTVYDNRCSSTASSTPTVAPASATPAKNTYAYPGQSCVQADVICLGGSRCVQGYCLCDSGFVTQSGVCTNPSVHVVGDKQPPSGNSNTNSNQNTAAPFPSGLVPARPGESCDPRCDFSATCGRVCTGGAVCVEGVCTCPQGQFAINGQCVPYSSATNTQIPPQNPPQTQPNSQSTQQKQTSRPSEPCDVQKPCRGGSSCVLGICQCPPGYAPSHDKESCVNGLLLSQNQQQESQSKQQQEFQSKQQQQPLQYSSGMLNRFKINPYRTLQSHSKRKAEAPTSMALKSLNDTTNSLRGQSAVGSSYDNNKNKSNNEKFAKTSPWPLSNQSYKSGSAQKAQATARFGRLGATRLGKKCARDAECVSGANCLFGVCACPPHTVGTTSGICVPESSTPYFALSGEEPLGKKLLRNDSYRRKKSLNSRNGKDPLLQPLQQTTTNLEDGPKMKAKSSVQQEQSPSRQQQHVQNLRAPEGTLSKSLERSVMPGMICEGKRMEERWKSECMLGATCVDLDFTVSQNNKMEKQTTIVKIPYCICAENATTDNSNYCSAAKNNNNNGITQQRLPGLKCNTSCGYGAVCRSGYCLCPPSYSIKNIDDVPNCSPPQQ